MYSSYYQHVMSLAHEISKLEVLESYEIAAEKLNAFLPDCHEMSPPTQPFVSPLMIACDRNQPHIVRFLVDKNIEEPKRMPFIGSWKDPSPDDGNSSVHLAAMSGSCSIIDELSRLAERDPTSGTPFIQMAQLQNSHGELYFEQLIFSSIE